MGRDNTTSAGAGQEARDPFILADRSIPRGKMATVELPISRLSTHTEISLPIRVLHGAKPGPTLFVSAGVHGDEIVGVEIIRRLLGKVRARSLSGTLICIPVVNVFGFVQHQRYLPDRRDLNRSFPGSASGSLAAQLASVFTREIICRSDYGIDLHSAAVHRTNLPQIRICKDRPKAEELAMAFGAPAILTAPLRPSTLRETALKEGTDVLLYEAGEALRFDEFAIRVGVKGIMRVMAHLGMSAPAAGMKPAADPVRSSRSSWLRAPEGGIFRTRKKAGDLVMADEIVGMVSDPFGDVDFKVRAQMDGVIIGKTNLPVVNQGDALMHVAEVRRVETAARRLNQFEEAAFADPMLDEDEVL
ncbi:succinylglutamate desuccinylase/aspartoacylase domain-containing protein [Aurantiacibacter rhizosphaerae]